MQAVLTLPGIAGLVLTLGMAVDANVLINERIREESQRGKTLRLAIRTGYERAFMVILDTHLTTIITALILFGVGTGAGARLRHHAHPRPASSACSPRSGSPAGSWTCRREGLAHQAAHDALFEGRTSRSRGTGTSASRRRCSSQQDATEPVDEAERRCGAGALLYNFTTFKSEEASVANSSFTTVQLEQINEVHLRKIANRNELRKYILQNLPVDFSELFDYRTKIIEKLTENVPGFKAVVIELQSDDEADEVVSKPPLKGLRVPEFGRIEGEDGKPVAYYWACLNQDNKRLGPDNLILANTNSYDPGQYQGFVYKCKGFTIGNRDQLNKVFKAGSGTLYGWYTGEIYVTDQLVIPNTARDDFETNAAKTRLEIAVNKKLEVLEDDADKVRQRAQADGKISDALVGLNELNAEISKNGIDSLDDFSKLRDIRAALKKYKAKASPSLKEKADQALKMADRLDKEIRISVGKSADSSGRVSSRTKFTPPLPFPTPEAPAVVKPQTLLMMIDHLDMFDSPNSRKLIEAIDSTLIAIVGTEAVVYKRLVESVESILQGEE